MNPPVFFPDVEAALVEWLPSTLATYGVTDPVSTKIPNPRPARFVRVFRTGGPQRNIAVDGAQVTVECWAQSDPAAATMAQTVRAVLSAIRNETTASGVLMYRTNEFSGPARLPDESGQSRYTWTLSVPARGVQI